MRKNVRIVSDMVIIEKRLGISPDYQYKAIRSKNFLQENWHKNKWTAVSYVFDSLTSKRVLDLGTGSGNFELLFAHQTKQIVGVDHNLDALDFLRGKLKENHIINVTLFQSDIRNLKLPAGVGKFDIIIMIDVIEHISSPDARKLVSKFNGLLRPSGQVCIITPNYHSLWLFIESILDKWSKVPKLAGHQHLAQYDPFSLGQLFTKAGFSQDFSSTFNLISFLIPSDTLSNMLTKAELMFHFRYCNLVIGVFKKTDDGRI